MSRAVDLQHPQMAQSLQWRQILGRGGPGKLEISQPLELTYLLKKILIGSLGQKRFQSGQASDAAMRFLDARELRRLGVRRNAIDVRVVPRIGP